MYGNHRTEQYMPSIYSVKTRVTNCRTYRTVDAASNCGNIASSANSQHHDTLTAAPHGMQIDPAPPQSHPGLGSRSLCFVRAAP